VCITSEDLFVWIGEINQSLIVALFVRSTSSFTYFEKTICTRLHTVYFAPNTLDFPFHLSAQDPVCCGGRSPTITQPKQSADGQLRLPHLLNIGFFVNGSI
jgi:hypothetical protein